MADYRIISSDSHVIEPPDLWTSRLEPKFRDRAATVIRNSEGDWWYCEGRRVMGLAPGSQAGVRFEDGGVLTATDTLENVRPGGYIPEEHIKDLDIDGVDVSIVYPSVGLLLYTTPESEFFSDVCRAYNDWVAEFCKPFPNRLKGIAMLNSDDLKGAVKELERCANMGLAGALVSVSPPAEKAYDLPECDPLWAAAQDLLMPLSLHIGTGRPGPGQHRVSTNDLKPHFICNIDQWVRQSLAKMIFSGVFARFPNLFVGSVEHELSWVPHFLERLDYTYTQRARDIFRQGRYWDRYTGDMLPSEYFRRNVFVGFQEDGIGIKLRDIIGLDVIQWGNDYPHQESTFPKSREILEEILAECTEEEKAKIVGGNAARVYHLN